MDRPDLAPTHINVKELAAISMAAHRWGYKWRGQRVVVYTDSEVAMAIVNKGSTPNKACTELLKGLSLLALRFDFSLTAVHIPGVSNTMADAISRLDENGAIDNFLIELKKYYQLNRIIPPVYNVMNHMSYKSLSTLPTLQQVQTRSGCVDNWTLK